MVKKQVYLKLYSECDETNKESGFDLGTVITFLLDVKKSQIVLLSVSSVLFIRLRNPLLTSHFELYPHILWQIPRYVRQCNRCFRQKVLHSASWHTLCFRNHILHAYP